MITLLIWLLNNNNRYMKVALKSKLIGVARLLILGDCSKFFNLNMAFKTQGNFKRKRSAPYMASNTVIK